MSWIGLSAIAAVAAILLRTVVAQRRQRTPNDHLFDTICLFPQWGFFGMSDLITDLHVVVRDYQGDGSFGPWQPVLFAPARPLWCFAWYPRRRFSYAVGWYCEQVLEALMRKKEPRITLGYIGILQHCMSCLPRAGAHSRQFAIALSRGRGERRTVSINFLSDRHPW